MSFSQIMIFHILFLPFSVSMQWQIYVFDMYFLNHKSKIHVKSCWMSSLKRFCYVTLLDLCREGLYQTKRLLSWVPDHNITLNKSWLHQLWSWAQPIRIVRFYSTISYERTSSLTGFHHRTQFVHVLLFWSAGFTLVSGSTYDTFSSRDHFIKINVIIKINASVDVHSWFPGECL